jgi:cysteine desulfurase
MHALVGAGSVDSVVRVTGNFTSESPLHPAAKSALLAAFDQGWADPKKISQSSSRAAILRNQALENIATKLAIPVTSIEVLGEPALGHYLSIAGLLHDRTTFLYSSIDKGKIRAVARLNTVTAIEIPVDTTGLITSSKLSPEDSVLSWQLANGETGIIQSEPSLPREMRVAVDATISGPRLPLPERWNTALFDSPSWRGPAGLAIMAIKDRSEYKYPLPHIAPINSPGSYSLPLLIASAVALEHFSAEDPSLRKYAIAQLQKIDGISVVAPTATALSHLLSITVKGISGESIVREMSARNIDLDSGSACSPEDLQPSHVLAAMGYETTGHIRITLHDQMNQGDVDSLITTLKGVAEDLRR